MQDYHNIQYLIILAALHERYALNTAHHGHPMAQHHHLYAEPAFVDTDSVLQVCIDFE